MGLSTGLPLGNILSQEDIYVESAPYIYFQDYTATELNHPDSDGYYWNLSGTSTYPVLNIGCVSNVVLTENLTINDVRCDTIGITSTVQQREYLEFTFEITSLFPLTILRHLMKAGIPTVSGHMEKMGIGDINNNLKYHVYAPKVYDADTGDFIAITLHKAKFVDAWSLAMTRGDAWKLTGIKLRAYADDTMPSEQKFASIFRVDPSAI